MATVASDLPTERRKEAEHRAAGAVGTNRLFAPLRFSCSSLSFDFFFLIHQDKGHQLQPISSPSSGDSSSTGNSIIRLFRIFQLFKLLPFQSLGPGRTSRCTPSILSRGGAQVSPGEGRSPGGARQRLQEIRHRSSQMGGPAETTLRRYHRFDILIWFYHSGFPCLLIHFFFFSAQLFLRRMTA